MKHKSLAIAMAMAIALATITLITVFVLSPARIESAEAQVEPDAAAVTPSEGPILYASRPMPIVGAVKWDAHLRVPADDLVIEYLLRNANYIPKDATPGQVEATVKEFKRLWRQRQPTTPNPEKFRELLRNERLAAEAGMSPKALGLTQTEPKILAVLVEFPHTDTFTVNVASPITPGLCIDVLTTTTGPLHNEIPAPGPRDNNTLWYDDTTPELYEELFFGTGPSAGVTLTHPNLGVVDLTGLTMGNYYLEQSEGTFAPTGTIYSTWVQAAHSEGWYGANSCTTGSSEVRGKELVIEAIDLLNATEPNFPWVDYDLDGDGIVDNFTVIHAGMGEEAGGGPQGDFSIWSHAGSLESPGYVVCTAGSTGCAPDKDLLVRTYSMDPENIDVGVIAEEYGHAAFGLPDIYVADGENSPSNWIIMSAGSWNGPLGGAQPAPFPLWFRYLIGWSDPVELTYTTDLTEVVVGQHSLRPGGTEQGIKINLPDVMESVANEASTGQGWWSDLGDLMESTIAHDFDLTTATAPITLSFASYWSIEQDWDYGYVEVSTDGGTIWDQLADLDGEFVDNRLTGEGSGTLRFDLSAYASYSITLRIRYSTDIGFNWDGWWVDDISLDDATGSLFFDDVEAGAGGWTANHFRLVPYTEMHPHYYLVEWRNYSGFDEGLVYPYQTVYYDEDEWEVDRAPYYVPGALVWVRDGSYRFDYVLGDSLFDSPSWGPKYGLSVVDSHPFPMMWDNYQYSDGQNVMLSSRVQPRDAAFTLDDTTPFTLRLGYDPATGIYSDTVLETKMFTSRPAMSEFHDSLGYYPGFWCCDGPYLVWWDWDASTVVPAMDDYSVRITDPDNETDYDLYGGGFGSGNPGDDNVQYGINIEVLDQASDGSWGEIAVYNQSVDFETTHTDLVEADAGDTYTVTYVTVVENVGTEIASNVYVTYTLDPALTFVSLTQDDGIGTVQTPIGTLVPPAWWTDELPAGATVTLTLTATGVAETGWLTTWIEAYDGLIERGPWLFDTYVEATYYIYLPVVMKNSTGGTLVIP